MTANISGAYVTAKEVATHGIEYGSFAHEPAGMGERRRSQRLDDRVDFMGGAFFWHRALYAPKLDTGDLWRRICDVYGQIDRIFSRESPAATTHGTAAASIGELCNTYNAPVRYRRPAV